MQRELIRRFATVAAIAVASVALALAATRSNTLRAIENVYYDTWHVVSGVRGTPQHTLLVTIDDDTLLALKDDPLAFWSPYFARAMELLSQAGAVVIGLDVLYQVSAEAWLERLKLPGSTVSRDYDAALRAALAAGNKILITHLVPTRDGGAQIILPPQDQLVLLPGGTGDLGVANLSSDPDKVIRHFYPFFDPDPRHAGTAFGTQLALRASGADPFAADWTLPSGTLSRDIAPRFIRFVGPTGTIPTVSMASLLRPGTAGADAARAARGKIVIIGADNIGSPDRHFTPYDRGRGVKQMAGVEIHANIVETLLSPHLLAPPALWIEDLYIVGLVLLGTLGFVLLGLRASIVCGLAFLVFIPVPAALAFVADVVLPVAVPQLGVASAFVLALSLKFSREEREKRRIRRIFGRYVAEDVVKKILADEHRPDLSGEHAEVTVLFMDIRNFTSIAEKLSAHEVVEMLNACFTRASDAVLGEGGTVDKYIGDGMMAVFGSPAAHSDHARRGLRAALAIAREAATLRAWMATRFADRNLPDFGIGIGLHSGTAVIGDIGSPRRKEFTAIGDVVNTASRLEGSTKTLQCVIAASEATVRAAGADVRLGKNESLPVKGKAEPVQVYEVLGFEGKL